ncbi:hypothetical protein QQX98_006524 [Neonectria punicea]|uniref:Pathway-specific nitrogen regulator n=1 Tax=Neonectria punicea TaxID=979145 RepID=A0ABR1H117_9HYPO
MPRRNKVDDLDFEIHVDRSCISDPMDHDHPADMENEMEPNVEQTQAESKPEPIAEPAAELELDNTKDTDAPDMPESKDDTLHTDDDATPLAEEDAHHSGSESEAEDSRRESMASTSSGSYVSHRRTSRRTEALIHAAARDIVDQIELGRGRESMNSISGTDDSYISHSEGGSGRPSDAHSVAESHGRDSLQSHDEPLDEHVRESLGSQAPESVHSGRESLHSVPGVEENYVSHSRPGSARHSDAHSDAHSEAHSEAHSDAHSDTHSNTQPDAHLDTATGDHLDNAADDHLDPHSDAHSVAESHGRQSIHSGRESVASHRESVRSYRESIYSRAGSTRSHARESTHSAEDGYISRSASARQSDSHRSLAASSHHSVDDDRGSSHHENDDDVFSDHSPRSSMGSLSESEHRKMEKIAQMDGSPRISDISQYEPDQSFVPTFRETPRPAFRSPSSVKAMQMSSPPGSVLGSPRSRRGLPTVSRLGSPSISAQYSPKKTPPRFKRATPPLVLLHVTLLPLRWGWGDVLDRATTDELSQDGKTLRDAWRQLQDRMGDTTVERGILLPHPQNDYEVLEERLLEALELPMRRRARILECGHYLGPSNEMTLIDESDSEDDDYDDDGRISRRALEQQVHWCKTCRTDIRYDSLGPGKIFRVKVYASNGLMKAGAWEACWKEMERVDVEIEPLVNSKAQGELNRLEAEQERQLEMQEEQYQEELDDLHDDDYSDNEDLEREALEREEFEREELEREELERAELERAELERAELEREKLEREKLEREKLEREKLEREELEREEFERAELEREKQERERLEREELEREELERQEFELAELERERQEREKLEREELEREEFERQELEREELERKGSNHEDPLVPEEPEHHDEPLERQQDEEDHTEEHSTLNKELPEDHTSEHPSPDVHEDEVHHKEPSAEPEPAVEATPAPEVRNSTPDLDQNQKPESERLREIYGDAPTQDEAQHQTHQQYEDRPQPSTEHSPNYNSREPPPSAEAFAQHTQPPKDASLQELLAESVRVLMQDKKNVLIGLLSILILMLALRGGQPQVDPRTFQTLVVSQGVPTVTVTQVPVATADRQIGGQMEEVVVQQSLVQEIAASESQVESQFEEVTTETQREETATESQVVESQAAESQVDPVQENQEEKIPAEESQVEENPAEESQVEDISAEESQVQESQAKESQAEESNIVEREAIPNNHVEESPENTPTESLAVAESSSAPQGCQTTASASSSNGLDPCASCTVSRDDQASTSQAPEDTPAPEPLRERETIISERIVRIVETVTEVETATIRITETESISVTVQPVSHATQPSELFDAAPSSELEQAEESVSFESAPQESLAPIDILVEESVTLEETDVAEDVEPADEAIAEPSVEVEVEEPAAEERLHIEDNDSLDEPEAKSESESESEPEREL